MFYEETKATAFSVMCICSLDDFVSYCNYERKENEEIAYNIEREEERYTGLKEEEEQLETILQTNVKEIETLAME